MWLSITAIRGDEITARLENKPLDLVSINPGDEFTFSPENIADAIMANYPDDPGSSTDQYRRGCVISPRVHDGEPVSFLARQHPLEGDCATFPDSGWLLLAAGDQPGDLHESGQLMNRSLGFVLNRDDRWLHLIDEPVGSRFTWSPARGSYQRLADIGEDEIVKAEYESA